MLMVLCADLLKGSYYANPVVDTPDVSEADRSQHPEYYGQNICETFRLSVKNRYRIFFSGPGTEVNGVEGFEQAFKDLGRHVRSKSSDDQLPY